MRESKELSGFLPEKNTSVLEQKWGSTTKCTESIYGDGDGCLTWQDCVDGKCVPEPGRCETNEDCPEGLTCQGYHHCR